MSDRHEDDRMEDLIGEPGGAHAYGEFEGADEYDEADEADEADELDESDELEDEADEEAVTMADSLESGDGSDELEEAVTDTLEAADADGMDANRMTRRVVDPVEATLGATLVIALHRCDWIARSSRQRELCRGARSGVSGLSIPILKNIFVPFMFESVYKLRCLIPDEGRFAIVRHAG